MAAVPFTPGPDGHHDDLTIDELDGLTLAVPTDARELDLDREQWLREEQALAASKPRERVPGRRSRLALTAAVIVASMLVAAVSGAVGAFVMPRPASTPPAAPLATAIGPVGVEGGLLPDTTLLADGRHVTARNLRPAVLALIPADCTDCGAWLTEVRRQAAEFGLDVTLLVGPDQAVEGVDLVRKLGSAGLDLMVDPDSEVLDSFGTGTRQLILVRDDGVVTNVIQDPEVGLRLEPVLLPLNQALTG